MRGRFDRYLAGLRKTSLDQKTEHTDRSPLEMLLSSFAELANPDIVVQHEPKRIPNKGAPDFKVTLVGSILGYVENKAIGANLDAVLKSDQIRKYRSLSGNILLTDYLNFVLIDEKSVRKREILCFQSDLENPRFKLNDDKIKAVSLILQSFFSSPPQGISRAHDLALALATRSQLLRDFLGEELARQKDVHEEGRLYALYQAFYAQVSSELTLADFADAFAQMLAYALFLARLNATDGQGITLDNARQFVPSSFALVRELVRFIEELHGDEYADIRWVVDEVLSIINGLDLCAIHNDLSFKNRKVIRRKIRAGDEDEHRLFERDPFIYFYEDYLAKYDAKMRKSRGVYYTPPPIVSFIVRAIDDILKETLKIKDGLANHNRVTVLDFACGTGTFLLEVFERVFDNIGGSASAKGQMLVQEHLLKNVYGFEYLLAPYTIAHLKLSQYLADRDRALKKGERLQIFLTNTLEPIKPQRNLMLPALTAETIAAHDVKEKPILVITGNPPYSGHSKNKGAWISAAIDAYKYVDGKPLGEKNSKWLCDDYVKFIRFAQMKMDGGTCKVEENGQLREITMQGVEEGIVGIITNHSWLDNPTFRGMRRSLMQSFDQIYVLDLHGSTKKREGAADGSEDQNVFAIEQGVAISLFVKKKGIESGIWRSDWRGTQLSKYHMAASTQFQKVDWIKIEPVSPSYLFTIQDVEAKKRYDVGTSVRDIFPLSVLGFQTHRDSFAIAFERSDIERRINDLKNDRISIEAVKEKYGIKDNRDWNTADARKVLQSGDGYQERIILCAYRPFDTRWCLFGYETMDRPREVLLQNVSNKDNIQLIIPRQTSIDQWKHSFVAEHVAESCLVSNITSEGNYIFPLYHYPPAEGSRKRKADLFATDPFDGKKRIENIGSEFRAWLDAAYGHVYEPEMIFGYVYAVLNAPTYRSKFVEFLRGDFPRIPFPKTRAEFEQLAYLGWGLAKCHLLRDVPPLKHGSYKDNGSNEVEMPRYADVEKAVYINTTQRFAEVPVEVWDFEIGGYHVIDKYLKSRKGRTLSLDEVTNVENIINVIAFTIEQVKKIDAAYENMFEV